MVVRDPRDGRVEARIGEGQILGAGDDIGLHAGRRVGRHHLHPGFAQTPGDVSAARGDVDRRLRARRLDPLDEQIEVGTLAVRFAGAIQLGALGPDVAHLASSTAFRAASSIVGST